MELAIHHEEMSQKPGLAAISNCLLQDLTKRFKKVKDVQTVDFDLLYVAATFLDPIDTNYYLPLNKAKKLIFKWGIKWCDLPSETGQSEEQPIEDKEPPKKHFKHLAAVIGRKKDFLAASTAGTNSKIEEENWGTKLNSTNWMKPLTQLIFGSLWKNTWLSSITYEILVIPVSSAPVKRVFSTSEESCMRKRNQLSGKNLEREVLFKKNKELLKDVLVNPN